MPSKTLVPIFSEIEAMDGEASRASRISPFSQTWRAISLMVLTFVLAAGKHREARRASLCLICVFGSGLLRCGSQVEDAVVHHGVGFDLREAAGRVVKRSWV